MMKKFKINKSLITLEDLGENKGKITVKNDKYGSYDMYWGAMGGDISDFILRINSDYFADKLLGHISMQSFDTNKTFKEVRRYIREELCLPWYKHVEFQKDLREKITRFQNYCKDISSDQYFVDHFSFYFKTLPDFNLINDRFERESIEEEFDSLCNEPWYFIQTSETKQAKWLKKLHVSLQNKLKKETLIVHGND